MSEIKKPHDDVQAWLRELMFSTKLKPTPLAKQAGISPSTLLRALDENNPTALDRRTIDKIAEAFRVPGPYHAQQPMPTGFRAPELLALEHDVATFGGQTLTPDQYVKAVNTRHLELAGVVSGDEILFDMRAEPQSGDIVEANIYDSVGGAETVLRLYERPYLNVRTMATRTPPKPELVDGDRVRIMAVAMLTLRRRPS